MDKLAEAVKKQSKRLNEMQDELYKCSERLDFNDEDIEECMEHEICLCKRVQSLEKKVKFLRLTEGISAGLLIVLIVRAFKR